MFQSYKLDDIIKQTNNEFIIHIKQLFYTKHIDFILEKEDLKLFEKMYENDLKRDVLSYSYKNRYKLIINELHKLVVKYNENDKCKNILSRLSMLMSEFDEKDVNKFIIKHLNGYRYKSMKKGINI